MDSLQCPSVRFEERGREFASVVRLTGLSQVAVAKASARIAREGHCLKGQKLLEQDQKGVDLILDRVKSFERGMEARYRW